MKCVIGLGNPGKQYENNRHNIGFRVVDELVRTYALSSDKTTLHYWVGILEIDGQRFSAVKPLTYVNLSGVAVKECVDKLCEGKLSNLLIAVDDVRLPTGTLRLREKGSDGGHNGLKSIIQALGSQNFCRLRLGVGQEGLKGEHLKKFVLSDLQKSDIRDMTLSGRKVCEDWVLSGAHAAMNRHNTRSE